MDKVTVADLISDLQKLPATLEVAILDGFNGGGIPRAISGPFIHTPTKDDSSERSDYSDLQTKEDEQIAIMFYGSY